MRQRDLIARIESLETSIKVLKDRLVDAKVLRDHYNYNPHEDYEYSTPISLIGLRDQIEGIKDFLGVHLVTKPAIPAESSMEKLETTERS